MLVEVQHGNVGSFPCECDGDGPANAAVSPRDECSLACEFPPAMMLGILGLGSRSHLGFQSRLSSLVLRWLSSFGHDLGFLSFLSYNVWIKGDDSPLEAML
jgi:hypothetical protein